MKYILWCVTKLAEADRAIAILWSKSSWDLCLREVETGNRHCQFLFKYCHNPREWNIFILLKRPKYALNCRSLICLSDGLFINHVWSIWDWLWGISWRWGQCCSGTPTYALPSCRKPRSRTMNLSPDEQTSLLKGWNHPWGDSPQMGS